MKSLNKLTYFNFLEILNTSKYIKKECDFTFSKSFYEAFISVSNSHKIKIDIPKDIIPNEDQFKLPLFINFIFDKEALDKIPYSMKCLFKDYSGRVISKSTGKIIQCSSQKEFTTYLTKGFIPYKEKSLNINKFLFNLKFYSLENVIKIRDQLNNYILELNDNK